MPVIAGDGFFYLPLTPMIDSFSCTPFISERRFFNNSVTSIADVRHIVMTLLWRLIMSLRSVTSITTSAYQTCENSRLFFYLTLGRITCVG